MVATKVDTMAVLMAVVKVFEKAAPLVELSVSEMVHLKAGKMAY